MGDKDQIISVEGSLAYQIYTTARLLRRHFMNLAAKHNFDLYQEQWFILNRLRRQPGLSQVEIISGTLTDRPTMTRALTSLEDRGILIRRDDPNDKRKKSVFLTHEGIKMHDDFASIVKTTRQTLLKGINEEEMKVFRKIMGQLADNLEV